MARERSTGSRSRTGICINEVCDKAKNKEIQAVRGGKDFVCEECGKELREYRQPKSKWVKHGIKIIAGVVVLVIGTGAFWYFSIATPEPPIVEPPVIETQPIEEVPENENVDVESMAFMETEKDMQLKLNEEKQLNLDCTPRNANEEIKWNSSNEEVAIVLESGLVKAIAPGKATITAVTDRTKTSVSLDMAVTGGAEKGSMNLSGRIWEGPTQNGKPHGIGVMKFTSSQIIDSRDPNQSRADKGDYMTGAKYDNGKLIQGQLHRTDGTQKAIVIGQ